MTSQTSLAPRALHSSLLVIAFGFLGCSGEDSDRPPELVATGPANPVVCDSLSDPQTPPTLTKLGTFLVNGSEAGCLADGQQCVLSWAAAPCDAGTPVAECREQKWRFYCWTPGDLPDAGGPGDAPASDTGSQDGAFVDVDPGDAASE